MKPNLEEATALVLQLSVQDRVLLSQRLAESVDAEMESAPALHRSWVEEARRRADELRLDPSKGIPVDEALAEVYRTFEP